MQWQVLEYYTNGEVGDYGPFDTMKKAIEFAYGDAGEDYSNVIKIEIKPEE